MGDGWADYIDLNFTLDKVETNPGMMQKIGRDETTVIVVMEVEVGDIVGKINICLPSNFLFGVFQTFEEKPAKKNPEDETTKSIFDGIKTTPMEICAELGKSTILLKDLFTLQVGDVINLKVPEQEIEESFKLEEGATVLVTGGKHTGELGTVSEIIVNESSNPNTIVIENSSKDNFLTLKDYAFVVGNDTPAISLLEVNK